MKDELYKKVYIKTEADLPKEAGHYVVCKNSGEIFRDYMYPKFNDTSPDANMWLRYISWYLQPIAQPKIDSEEEKEETIPTAFEWHNHDTGHCYVDYVPHNLQDENNGYTKTPLYQIIKIDLNDPIFNQPIDSEPSPVDSSADTCNCSGRLEFTMENKIIWCNKCRKRFIP